MLEQIRDKLESGSSRKSEKRFINAVGKAVRARQEKLDKGRLSLESGLGKLVIIASGAPDNRLEMSAAEQRRIFNEEADYTAELRKGQHQEVEVKYKADPFDIKFDLADPEVTDMVLVGHGSIGDFWMNNGGHFGWKDVASASCYLKQGSIEQRICGNFALQTSVPWGTFAVSDQRKVIAAPGKKLDMYIPDDTGIFVPVYKKPTQSPEEIIELVSRGYELQNMQRAR